MRNVPLILLACCTATVAGADFTAVMEHEHAGDRPVASPAAEVEPGSAVEGETVTYANLSGTEIAGYLARPAGAETARPGVLLIHEWWGLNDNIRAMARRFAGEGYVALAVDLYEGAVATESDDAARLMRASAEHEDRVVENLHQAVTYLKERGVTKLGVVGWCFGGGWSLRTALAFPERIDATTIYYGRLVTDSAELEKLRAPILGLFGEEDQGIPVDAVRAFEAALEALGKSAQIHVYPGAGHAFANASGTRYNREAAEDAWAKTVAFFAANLH